jgi:glycosyltransferase involved in cell wall biosynthesis
LSFEMSQRPPELLFIPAHTLPRILPKKTVVTVHDVAFRRHPELYPAHQVAWHEITTRDIAQSNAHILTVSAFCKQELQELYRIHEDRITVTPLGVDTSYVPTPMPEQERIRATHGLGSAPFFLYVGRLEKKKNIQRLVKAFLSLAEQESDTLCVLVGDPGFGWNETRALIDRHPQGYRVRVLGYISEGEKRALLSAAQAYVQPSLYEGFGLPVLEAMACGAAVVSSSAGSLREVGAGGGALFVDPYSADSIAAGMAAVQRLSAVDRAHLAARGAAHAAQFTWHETAKKTLAAFERYV